jgi:hypothetical protein
MKTRTKVKAQMTSDMLKLSDSMFMPKKTIVRPDGASYMDVYESKKGDLWGQIIKAQYLEDLENKKRDKFFKEKKNHDFGVTFKADLDDIRWRKENQTNDDDKILAIVEAKSKADDDVQQQRKRDAIRRQKQFVENCLEDVGVKRKQQLDELENEMRASSIMIEKNNYMIEQDRLKAENLKKEMKKIQDSLMLESIEISERKQREKEAEWAEIKKIQKEAVRRADIEDKRRKDDLAAMLRNAEDGPAHGVTKEILERSQKFRDDQLSALLNAGDGLNKQLLDSEEATKARMGKDFKYLFESNLQTIKIHDAQKQKDHEFNLEMGRLALQRSIEFQKQEAKNRWLKKQAGLTYQGELNSQLSELRQRSLNTLKETMVAEERKINMALFRKYGSQIKLDV